MNQTTVVRPGPPANSVYRARVAPAGRVVAAGAAGRSAGGVAAQVEEAGRAEEDFRFVDECGNEFRYRLDGRGGAIVTECSAAAAEVCVPARVGGHAVVAIGDEAFSSSGRLSMQARIEQFASGGSARAHARNVQLHRVVLPDGVVSLGRAAFRGCANLSEVLLPDTLEEIGDLAFSCSGVESLRLPARCMRLSALSLRLGPETVSGAETVYHSKLSYVEAHPDNPAFAVRGGVLCRCGGADGYTALLCPARADRIVLGREVSRVAAGAFAGTEWVGALRVAEGMLVEHPDGLLPHGRCGELAVDFAYPRDGFAGVQVRLPEGPLAGRVLSAACVDGRVCAEGLLAAYDAALADVGDRLEQAMLVVARLAAPALLDDADRAAFAEGVKRDFSSICIHFGARGYWEGFELMADAGLLDAARIADAVALLTRRCDTTACAYLLELKRARFNDSAWDYGI